MIICKFPSNQMTQAGDKDATGGWRNWRTQFSSQDAASSSHPVRLLLHKELVGKVMVHELYKAVENGN